MLFSKHSALTDMYGTTYYRNQKYPLSCSVFYRDLLSVNIFPLFSNSWLLILSLLAFPEHGVSAG